MIYRFGDCTLDTDRRWLAREGAEVHVEPQVFDLLALLAGSGGRVLSKDEIVDAIWDGRAISDDALTSRVRSARQAVGDDGRRQWAIRTVHRVGYQFVAFADGSAFSSAPAPRAELFDRAAALAAVAQAATMASTGQGRLVTITGEAGIGKTSLLRAAIESMPGLRILRGACEDLSVAEPLGALRDAARDLGLSETPKVGTDRPVLDAYAAFLDRLAEMPTLLAVEDLHWADDATAAFLRFAARRIEALPVLLIVTARSDDAGGRRQLRAVLDGVSANAVTRLSLEPLSQATVRRLALATGQVPEDVWALTDGNPLFVTELMRSPDAVPVTIQDAVLSRADQLSASARQLVDLRSVFVRPPNDALLERLYDGDIDPALDEAADAGLLIDGIDGVVFPHELTRRAVLDAIGATRRRRLHRQVLEALRDEPGTPRAILLHHADRAWDRDAVADLAPEAASEAEQLGALREAARYHEMALEAGARSAASLQAAAHVHHLVGATAMAVRRQSEAIDVLTDVGDPVAESVARRRLARFLWSAGDLEPAITASDRALTLLDGQSGEARARALSTRAQFAMLDFDFVTAALHAEPAIAIARELGQDEVLAHALNNHGMSLMFSEPQRAHALLDESIALADAAGSLDDGARGRLNKAAMCEYQLDIPRMERLMADAHAWCAARELDGYVRYTQGLRALALLKLGRWNEAGDLATPIVSEPEQTMEAHAFPAHCVAAWLAIRRDAPVGSHLDALHAFVERADELQRLMDLAVIEAERAWLGQAPSAPAVDLLRRAVSRVAVPAHAQLAHLWLHRLAPGRSPDPSAFHPAIGLELAGNPAAAADEWRRLHLPWEEALSKARAGDEDALKGMRACLGYAGRDAAKTW